MSTIAGLLALPVLISLAVCCAFLWRMAVDTIVTRRTVNRRLNEDREVARLEALIASELYGDDLEALWDLPAYQRRVA